LPASEPIEQLFAELEDLDLRSFLDPKQISLNHDLLLQRAALIDELAGVCERAPSRMSAHLPSLCALLARSADIQARWTKERSEIAQTVQQLETQLRQLSSFRELPAADASLLDRLG